MANINKIKNRISSVKKIRKITQAMKMVSAAKFKKATNLVNTARNYDDALKEIINSFAYKLEDASLPIYFQNSSRRKIAVIVVAADRGLCGAFNSALLKSTQAFLEKQTQAEKIDLYLFGKRAELFFKNKKWPIKKTFSVELGHLKTEDILEKLAELPENFRNEEIDTILLFANKLNGALSNEMTPAQILPISMPQKNIEDEKIFTDFIYEVDQEATLKNLALKCFCFFIYQALIESRATEEKLRMVAMDAATKNANDFINSLTIIYNRTRQAIITKEISEIVAGAEALAD